MVTLHKSKSSVGDKQVLCLGPTVPPGPSLSSPKKSNIFATILFGGTAQTGGVGIVAGIIPPPTGVELGAVPPAASIFVPVPGQAQVVILLLIVSKFDLLGAELLSIVNSHGVPEG